MSAAADAGLEHRFAWRSARVLGGTKAACPDHSRDHRRMAAVIRPTRWSHDRDLLAENDDVSAGDLTWYLLTLGVLLMLSALSQAVASELQPAWRAGPPAAPWMRSSMWRRRSNSRCTRGWSSTIGCSGQEPPVASLRPWYSALSPWRQRAHRRLRVVVLFTVAPVLVPFALLGYFPIALVNVRNNRARYELDRELHPNSSASAYLEFLMTDRVEAKEVRSYDLPTFQLWHGGCGTPNEATGRSRSPTNGADDGRIPRDSGRAHRAPLR